MYSVRAKLGKRRTKAIEVMTPWPMRFLCRMASLICCCLERKLWSMTVWEDSRNGFSVSPPTPSVRSSVKIPCQSCWLIG